MYRKDALTAALVVLLGLGLVATSQQNQQSTPRKKATRIIEHDGVRITVDEPRVEEGKPVEMQLTVESSTSCPKEIPVEIYWVKSSPLSRVAPIPKLLKRETLQVQIQTGEKQTFALRLQDKYVPARSPLEPIPLYTVRIKNGVELLSWSPERRLSGEEEVKEVVK